VLFEIDPQPHEAALAQAKAQIPVQQAQFTYNEAVYQRSKGLVSQASSVEETQQSLAQRKVSEANLQAVKAAAEQAQINLNWTKVLTPITGPARVCPHRDAGSWRRPSSFFSRNLPSRNSSPGSSLPFSCLSFHDK
jgi:multidrug efflux pump subunit AcrA (membrane-fusion protein)